MRHLVTCAYVAAAVCGLNGVAAPATLGEPPADEQLMERVAAALHSDRYLYDKHVTVSLEEGNVVLRGFVTSDWDLLDAIRIANKAAGGRRVVNYVELVVGGLK
jgi:osmotically-inducible protein OsmY